MNTKSQDGLTSLQCRMARAGLEWGVRDLAAKARVGVTTITRFEKGHSKPIRGNISAIRQAFETAGVQFLNGDGLRVKAKTDG